LLYFIKIYEIKLEFNKYAETITKFYAPTYLRFFNMRLLKTF